MSHIMPPSTEFDVILESMKDTELQLNIWAQEHLKAGEKILYFLSRHISVSMLMDNILPIIGVFHYQLMVVLAAALSVANTFTSIIKWTFPTTRPYWYAREVQEQLNMNVTLQSHTLVCETSAGFPSSHITAFTTFVYIVSVFLCNSILYRFSWFSRLYSFVFSIIVGSSAFCMWISRIYFGTQFLHQCFTSTLATIFLLHFFDSNFVYQMPRSMSVTIVLGLGLIPIFSYFYMLHMDIDPFWTVRTGFKYCPDPLFLQHETSPVFILGRDFGFLMGIAISSPIYRRYISKPTGPRRLFVLFLVEVVNILARLDPPKQSGRLVFVAAEFLRNLFHSYSIIMILSTVD